MIFNEIGFLNAMSIFKALIGQLVMPSKLPFDYQIKRSAIATRVRIVVRATGRVEVVAPLKGVSDWRIEQFVREKHLWIEQNLARIANITEAHTNPIPDMYTEGMELLFRGQVHKLSVQSTPLKRLKLEFTDHFLLHLPEGLHIEQQGEAIKKILLLWLKKQTLLQVQEAVEKHAERKKLFPRSITIKSQKSRWGSCGYQGDININWLLILAPPDVLEYVVVHELCHIQVRNHSLQFWDLVTEHLPDYKQRRRWLKTHGRSLMIFHD
jgi:predicted metal-dependent hydrolase